MLLPLCSEMNLSPQEVYACAQVLLPHSLFVPDVPLRASITSQFMSLLGTIKSMIKQVEEWRTAGFQEKDKLQQQLKADIRM